MRRLLALLMMLTLAGCASLPTEIDVQSGPELIPLEQQEFAYYSPASPEEGASPQEIVSGFWQLGQVRRMTIRWPESTFPKLLQLAGSQTPKH